MRTLPKILIALAVLALIATGAVFGVRALLGSDAAVGPECVVQSDPKAPATDRPVVDLGSATQVAAPIALAAVQLQHASTINAVGLAKQLSTRARTIAVATALQESSLRNLPGGDRDSVGLFQQRPSQGWGTVQQISDPVYSAGIFYDRLLQVPDWESRPLTEAAQEVQYSGHPEAYAKWEVEAAQLVGALSGGWGTALSCRDGAAASTAPVPPRAVPTLMAAASPGLASLIAAANAELGTIAVVAVSADGKEVVVTIDVPVLADSDRAAMTLALWTVAHAASGRLNLVAVAGARWQGSSWGATESALPAGQVRISVAG
ncbi:heavy metal transporter [Nakamurella antarctica]|uniref:Heavy metal transporter n=1 Tax=Nakamurella antarctica TaxID=1902245 RepID=A0A3G8ZKZ2_9ACTN|nr:heavy metal transporter [Nakamurella antarctica]AZI57457.1 heavy metal transporter [Nakamurella antarctica]